MRFQRAPFLSESDVRRKTSRARSEFPIAGSTITVRFGTPARQKQYFRDRRFDDYNTCARAGSAKTILSRTAAPRLQYFWKRRTSKYENVKQLVFLKHNAHHEARGGAHFTRQLQYFCERQLDEKIFREHRLDDYNTFGNAAPANTKTS